MEVLTGKSSLNGPFSMAMLNNQRVTSAVLYTFEHLCERKRSPMFNCRMDLGVPAEKNLPKITHFPLVQDGVSPAMYCTPNAISSLDVTMLGYLKCAYLYIYIYV